MAYSSIASSEIDADSPITASLMSRIVNNPIAIAAGDTGAPRVAIDLSSQTAIGTDEATTTKVLTPNGSGSVKWTSFASLESDPYYQFNESYDRDPNNEVESEVVSTGFSHFIAYGFCEYLWNDVVEQVSFQVVNTSGTHGAMAEVRNLSGNMTDISITTSGSSISIAVTSSPSGERLRHITVVAFQLVGA